MRSVAGPILAVAAVAAALAGGCGPRQSRRDVYVHLMTPLQQAHYLHMEALGKPVSLRLAYLQEIGVYQTWAELPKDIQDAALRRQVVEGMTPLAVRMAWGLPDEERDATQPAERAAGETMTIWDYGIRSPASGGDRYERSVCFVNDRVLWVRTSR